MIWIRRVLVGMVVISGLLTLWLAGSGAQAGTVLIGLAITIAGIFLGCFAYELPISKDQYR